MLGLRTLYSAPLSGAEQDKGCGGKAQEDAFAIFKAGIGKWKEQPDKSVFFAVVADGVTNKAGGETASRIAVECIQEYLEQKLSSTFSTTLLKHTLGSAIIEANNAILSVAQQMPSLNEMSTTLVLIAIAGNQLWIAHVGDSRAYLIRDGEIYRLTLDHTWVQDVLDRQQMSESEILANPNRNVIQRFLGTKGCLDIDQGIVLPGTYHLLTNRTIVESIQLKSEDTLLICSDGLTDKLSDSELCRTIVNKRHMPEIAAKQLVQQALLKKERDNITAVILSFPSGRLWLGEIVKDYAMYAAAICSCLVLMAMYFRPYRNETTAYPSITQVVVATNVSGSQLIIDSPTLLSPTETSEPEGIPIRESEIITKLMEASTITPLPLSTERVSHVPTDTALPRGTLHAEIITDTNRFAIVQPTDTPRPWATATPTRVPPTLVATRTATATVVQVAQSEVISSSQLITKGVEESSAPDSIKSCNLTITGISSGDSVTPRINNIGWNGNCSLDTGEQLEFRAHMSNGDNQFVGVSGDVCHAGLYKGNNLSVARLTTNGSIELGLFVIQCPSGRESHLVSELVQVYVHPESGGGHEEQSTPVPSTPTIIPATPTATPCITGQPCPDN